MYEKPMAYATDDLAEGVYLASGFGDDHWTITTLRLSQDSVDSRQYYVVHMEAKHHKQHTVNTEWLHLSFNKPVTDCSSSGNATIFSGNGTANPVYQLNYHANPGEGVGLAEINVKADPGLAITGGYISDED